MPVKLPVSLIAYLSFTFCFAQEKTGQNFSWPGKPTYEIIPDTFKNHRAVILSETREILILPEPNSPDLVKEFTYHCKIKTLAAGSVFFRFPYETSGKIVLLSARKISKNGNVIPIAPHEIKSQAFRETDYYTGKPLYTYEILSTVPGDQVEFICKTVKEDPAFWGEFFFHSYYPVLSSVFILETEKSLLTETAAYNKPGSGTKTESGNRVTYTFTSGKLLSLVQESFAVPSASLPFVRYAVSRKEAETAGLDPNEKNIRPLLSQTLFLLKLKDFVIDADKDKIIKKFMNERLVNRTVINFYESLEQLHEYINSNIRIREIGSGDPEKVFQVLTEQGETDRRNLLLMYAVLFSELQADYFIGFGRSRYLGKTDTAFNMYAQASHVFFAFEWEGKLHYLFPKTDVNSYHIGEIPPELSGTEARIVQCKSTPNRIRKINFDSPDAQTNFYKNRITCIPNLENFSLQFLSEENWSGALATQHRQKILNSDKQNMLFQETSKSIQYENPSLVLDSVEIKENSRFYPYLFRVIKKYRMAPGITKENDSTWSLSFSGMLNQYILASQTRTRIQDLHAYSIFSDQVTISLRFENGVSIPGLEKYSVELRNELGKYTFRIRQISAGNYVVESFYEISKQVLPAQSYGGVADLHDAYKRATARKIIVYSAK